MESWMLMKEEGEKSFKFKDYQKSCDHYKDALTEIESKFDESNHELKVEAGKIASNISLMYYKLSKEKNDEFLLHESKIYAKKAISYNPKWIKGYLRLVDVCKLSKNLDDIVTAITVYLQDNKDDVLNNDFISLLKEVKYYTHKTIIELSPSWDLVKYKNNVFVVDHLGAGHFKDLQDFINCRGECSKNVSVLVRPGLYVGTYVFNNANIDIVGDCTIEINPITKAIDKDPTVIFTNTLVHTAIDIPGTFFFNRCEVSLKRISVHGEMDDQVITAIRCERTVINMLECSFVSKNGFSLNCSDSANLYCKSCRSVGSIGGVAIRESRARLTDCFISDSVVGVVAKDDTEMIKLKHCTITKCKEQGLLVCGGTKMAEIIDSRFEDMDAIRLIGCRALVKNTSIIQSQNSVGIYIIGGSVNCVNVRIEKGRIGIYVQGNVEIINCSIDGCSEFGIMSNFLKGNIFLENNSITNCATEIAISDNTPTPIFKGEKKHAMVTLSFIDGKNEARFKERRKSRRKGSIDANITVDDSVLKNCAHSSKDKLQLQGSSKTLKVCEACKMVLYCSSECQLKDWKIHKPICDVFVKTKLAAKEGIKANQTKEGNSSGDNKCLLNSYCSIL